MKLHRNWRTKSTE